MLVKNSGKYKALKDFNVRSTFSSSIIKKGEIIAITQIDEEGEKVIGKDLMDWINWDLPVEPI